jgi:hypothetical protein
MVELLCPERAGVSWLNVQKHAGKVGISIGGGLARTGRNEESTCVCRSDFNAIAAAPTIEGHCRLKRRQPQECACAALALAAGPWRVDCPHPPRPLS